MGSWVKYAMGSVNEQLRKFVVLTDAGEVIGGTKNWSAGFLPASFQGTLLRNTGVPILNLAPPDSIGDKQQRSRLDLLKSLNEHFDANKQEDTELDARIHSYELAYRMQSAAPAAVDLTPEYEVTKTLYEMTQEPPTRFLTTSYLA